MPLEWVDYREAARLYHTEQVAYTCGTLLYRLFGGTCARTGLRTTVDVNSIIATLNLEEILQRCTVDACQLMEAKVCSVMLLNAERDRLELRACHGASWIRI